MCQAIVKPQGVTISKEVLHRAWQSNADGAGFAYLENGQVHVNKGYFKFKSFWKAYRKKEYLDCLIHFRWSTHGTKSLENCHPFTIADGAMIHNGVINTFAPLIGSVKSDTRTFVDEYLSPIQKALGCTLQELLDQPITTFSLEQLIGASKLAFLTPEGFTIINETWGEWREGAWYSAGFIEPLSLHRIDSWELSGTCPIWWNEDEASSKQTQTMLVNPCYCVTCDRSLSPYESICFAGEEVCQTCFYDLYN